MQSLFSELKRRNIFRVAGVYVVVAWITMQVISVMTPALSLPDWVDSFFAILLIAGFPIALTFAWAFELTPEGVKRTTTVQAKDSIRDQTGRKLDFAVLAGLGVVAALIIASNLFPGKTSLSETALSETTSLVATETKTAVDETGTSIAVLAFADMSSAGDQEYFSDGMAEEILNALVKVPELRVAGRTSSFSFKGKDSAIPEIGKALNVAHVLEGSVRKQGNNVRITVQLIKSEDGIHLWSETYDGTLDNIFDLQDQVSRAIADELKIKLNLGESGRLAKQLTTSQEAYDLYLRGRRLSNISWGQDTLLKSIDLYERAVALDPGFLDAWVVLALDSWRVPLNIPVKDHTPYLEKAENALQRAFEINPTDPGALYNRAQLALINRNYAEGARIIERLPVRDTSYAALGYHYLIFGRTREALSHYERATHVAPLNTQLHYWRAVAQLQLGQFENSKRSAVRSYELGFGAAVFPIADALRLQGDVAGALSVILDAYDENAYFFPQFSNRDQLAYAVKTIYGNDVTAKKQLISIIEQTIDPSYPVASSTVGAWRLLAEPERFIDAIDRHISAHTASDLIFIWGEDRGGRMIRQHPKFAAWADKVGLVTAWQEFGWPDKCKPNPGTDGSEGQFTCI